MIEFLWVCLAFMLVELGAKIQTTDLPIYHWKRWLRAAFIVGAFHLYRHATIAV